MANEQEGKMIIKKTISILVVLILVTFALSACGGGGGGDYSKNFIGTWSLVGVESEGEVFDEEMIELMESAGMTFGLILNEDGTGRLDVAGDETDIKWEAKDASTVMLIAGDSIEGKLADEKLTIEFEGDKLTFQIK